MHSIKLRQKKLFKDWRETGELKNFVYYSKQRGDGESKLLIHKLFYLLKRRKDGNPARKSNKNLGFCPSRMIVI